MIREFKRLLEEHDKVSILIHRHTTADTIGTALGIYEILKNEGKQVELCNVVGDLPNYLDFLPHFAKIKNQMDFDNSLIISCDSPSIDLLGFDLRNKTIVNIDCHASNTNYGALNIVNNESESTSVVAYALLKENFEITKRVATCFYVALVTATQNFSRFTVSPQTFLVASELIAYGIDMEVINKNLTQRKSLSSLRILSKSIEQIELFSNGQIASILITKDLFAITGAKLSDTIGIIDAVLALTTVQIVILIIEVENTLKVSFRSDAADVLSLAAHFGGGGHVLDAGFTSESTNINQLLEIIKKEIKKRGLVNGIQ